MRKESPVLPVPAPAPATVGFCHHLGVLLFSGVLVGVEKEVAASGWLLKQWLATLLLGAVNLEQTKLLDFEDLRRLLGRTLRSLFPQRSQLTELAAGTTATQLLSLNAQLTGAAQQRDFYFDPHTKHYTGMQNVLKGWCARIRWADKVLHSDFFHTAAGQPVYLECADNYQDMRERFAALLPRFRQALGLPTDAVVSCVIDRGIFSHRSSPSLGGAGLSPHHLGKEFQTRPWDPRSAGPVCAGTDSQPCAGQAGLPLRIPRPGLGQKSQDAPTGRAGHPSAGARSRWDPTDDRQRAAAHIIYLMFNR
jgi:hypothetical protein